MLRLVWVRRLFARRRGSLPVGCLPLFYQGEAPVVAPRLVLFDVLDRVDDPVPPEGGRPIGYRNR